MCWITCQKWRTRPRIAKKRIEVWKVYLKRHLNSEEYLMSPYQRERIYLNMRNVPLSVGRGLRVIEMLTFFRNDINWEIWQGYHSYEKGTLRFAQTKHIDTIRFYYKNCQNSIPEEYKSVKDLGRKYAVVKCYIPVGAEYYLNEYGCYVSNKIIVGDVIPNEDLLKC